MWCAGMWILLYFEFEFRLTAGPFLSLAHNGVSTASKCVQVYDDADGGGGGCSSSVVFGVLAHAYMCLIILLLYVRGNVLIKIHGSI